MLTKWATGRLVFQGLELMQRVIMIIPIIEFVVENGTACLKIQPAT